MKKVTASEVINEKNELKKKELYNQYVSENTPKNSTVRNIFNAFWMGGLICLCGQGLMKGFSVLGASGEDSKLFTTISLILLSVIFTALGVYAKLAKTGGAGTVVPITGFANSVSSTAIEYKKEGQVFGIGCQIFSIAGPVILYGIFASWCLGLIYWLLKVSGVIMV